MFTHTLRIMAFVRPKHPKSMFLNVHTPEVKCLKTVPICENDAGVTNYSQILNL